MGQEAVTVQDHVHTGTAAFQRVFQALKTAANLFFRCGGHGAVGPGSGMGRGENEVTVANGPGPLGFQGVAVGDDLNFFWCHKSLPP